MFASRANWAKANNITLTNEPPFKSILAPILFFSKIPQTLLLLSLFLLLLLSTVSAAHVSLCSLDSFSLVRSHFFPRAQSNFSREKSDRKNQSWRLINFLRLLNEAKIKRATRAINSRSTLSFDQDAAAAAYDDIDCDDDDDDDRAD